MQGFGSNPGEPPHLRTLSNSSAQTPSPCKATVTGSRNKDPPIFWGPLVNPLPHPFNGHLWNTDWKPDPAFWDTLVITGFQKLLLLWV